MTSSDATATPASTAVPPTDDRPIGQLVNDAVADLRTIIDHEKALAAAEIKAAAVSGGIGAGLIAVAVSLVSLGGIFLLVAAAEGFAAAGLSRWAAYLLTGGIMIVVALILVGVAILLLRRIGPPKRAIETTKATVTTTLAQVRTLGRPLRG